MDAVVDNDVAASETAVDASCPTGQTACDGRCVNTQDDRSHCGACGNACAGAQVCVMGACQVGCPSGQSVCAGRCVDVQTDRANCGACGTACGRGEVCAMGRCALDCGPSLAMCAGGVDGGVGAFCADTRVDRANCGACGNACAAGEICDGGRCAISCPAGQAACAGRCADLQTDPRHCGACGTACGAGQVCAMGACQLACAGGTTRCGDRCADLQNDPRNCGMCGAACPSGQSCVAGVCSGGACASPLSMCGNVCVDTRYDPDHCGGCGRACAPFPNLTRACGNGACVPGVCLGGFADCNGMQVDGCEVSTTSDPNNCGGCGRACTNLPNASAMCAAGACSIGACTMGYANCDGNPMNGCEVALQTDRMNCGACGNACESGRVCVDGACTAQPLYHGWTCPIPGCVTTSYNATAPTNLGGRYPYNAGDSNACRAWKLAATVCTTQPTPYSDTNNWYCPSSGGFTDPVFGTYCARPNQYACSTCPGACNAACAYTPLSLRNCAGSEQSQP